MSIILRPGNLGRIESVAKAGYVQCREWALYKIRSDHYPFNMQQTFAVTKFDHFYFQEFLDRIVERHELLRTLYRQENDGLMQVIYEPSSCKLSYQYCDLSGRSAGEQQKFINQQKVNLKIIAFNLEFGTLMRINVYKKAEDSFLVMITGHHIVLDEYSLKILDQEGYAFWQTHFEGNSHPVEEVEYQYRHYLEYENNLFTSRAGEECKKYWQNVMKDGLPRLRIIPKNRLDASYAQYIIKSEEVKTRLKLLNFYDERILPGVIRRYGGTSAAYSNYRFDKAFLEACQQYIKSKKISLLSLLSGCLMIALNKLSGQNRFVFEIPTTVRPDKKFMKTLGWISAGGPCFFDLTSNECAGRLFHYVDEQLYNVSRNCRFPFELAGSYFCPPCGSQIPVFLNLSYVEDDIIDCHDTGFIEHDTPGSIAFQDIAFFFNVYNNCICLELIYDTNLFSGDIIRRILNENTSVLREVMAENVLTVDY